MCPPHCGDGDFDDRALFHWPAPDGDLAEAMLAGLTVATLAAAALGVFFCARALRTQVAAIRRRERLWLDLSTLRAAWWLAVVAALVPSLSACVWALALSAEFQPLRFCGVRWSGGNDWVRIATVFGAVVPLAVFVVQTRHAKHRLVRELDDQDAGRYRCAPRFTASFADASRARQLVLHAMAVRVALASAVALLFVASSGAFGAPFTPGLFELTALALVVL